MLFSSFAGKVWTMDINTDMIWAELNNTCEHEFCGKSLKFTKHLCLHCQYYAVTGHYCKISKTEINHTKIGLLGKKFYLNRKWSILIKPGKILPNLKSYGEKQNMKPTIFTKLIIEIYSYHKMIHWS